MAQNTSPAGAHPASPVSEQTETQARGEPEEGTALCLSGGGYRAMLFHTGVLWRLCETKQLFALKRISSVSGGSIVSALLGLKWAKLAAGTLQTFQDEIVAPLRAFAHVDVDVASVGLGLFLPGNISAHVAQAYDKHLFKGATLQDLPDDPPRFVINATNVQSGSLWRFSKPYMRDYQVGRVDRPDVPLADAVAASSAFPPFLSPMKLDAQRYRFVADAGEPLARAPFDTDVYLCDGGVYDNLGLETVWKRYRTVLVSDAGQKTAAEEHPKEDWARHAVRVLDLVDNQVRSLRKRQLIASFMQGVRKGAYWSVRSNIADYKVGGLACPYARTQELAAVPTRLSDTDDATQERLINWGYAICDAALRAWVNPGVAAAQFPYARGV